MKKNFNSIIFLVIFSIALLANLFTILDIVKSKIFNQPNNIFIFFGLIGIYICYKIIFKKNPDKEINSDILRTTKSKNRKKTLLTDLSSTNRFFNPNGGEKNLKRSLLS